MDDQACRQWNGSRTQDGYGRVSCAGKYVLVHRLVWEAANGPIPPGMMVLHFCDNPPCYRLDHLRLGTHDDNMRDRQLAGHYKGVLGEANGQSKLTTTDVLEIRRLSDAGWLQRRIASMFDITQPQVSDIVNRKLWSHV